MGLLEALILGLVQGLTEFLPISSSAHLRIVSELLPGLDGKDTGAAFTAITQLGTETAVIIYFWRDIVKIVSSWCRSLVGKVPRTDANARMGWLIIIGSLPIIVLGLLFQDQIETTLRSLWVVATTLIVFGILLGVADAVGAKKRRLRDLNGRDGLIFGGAQALALVPGVSRSGGTITAGLFMGYERKAAARYSFLLAIPAVFGSGLYQLYKSISDPEILPNQIQVGGLETLVATIVAFVVGFVVIAFFMSYISRRSFLPFVIYRIVLGVVLMVALSTGLLAA
ncbi:MULTISPECIES: undecaprenyl-diphosphate phosphatase [Rathayibacter]|jgi:undecaprenyl-diphosphatase|uniref:Undecaprenyl-diphosphatase n=1 Tax=Rathayibacter festucae DSM 15932 TaxID=1328866 RepID=A0A3Q9UY71_9MICO|nr:MULTISPECIES: undecaprenyl-diphosphate phosphatase [Rathayibacter]AZZ51970.1 UDP-diphosphatase [Rathayibacter festucae DSM 15932]MCJ1700473.1 undecaprenyl-diphosphate phosphatase [Rathayibacter festucae]MCJ1705443.1 undecaprenyl-diphosphate phosphatase [Rathayibacter sp. VKM Ac-2926]ROP50250.1 undecaprenyl-diphosphatase [Rathayibacter sp. PhB186]ROQ05492.1 undecaprenyl-diphosphatase [Rathayibacter sp. PhB93]